MRPIIVALVAAAVLMGVLSMAQAQEPRDLTSLSPEDLSQVRAEPESNASRYLQKITDAPASVSIVTSDEIRLYGYRTLADVLNSVRGMSVSYDRNYTYLGFRGLSRPGDLNTRILILIDGHRLNDNVFDSALVGDEFPVDLENVDRVEIIRGPGAALYGTSAFSAVISVVTKSANRAHGVEAEASLGTLDTRRLRMAWGHTAKDGLQLFLSGSSAASAGNSKLYYREFDTPQTNNGIADHADGQRFDRLAMNLEAGHLSVRAVYAARLKHIPTASFGTLFNDARTRTLDERGYVDIQYGREFGRRSDVVARAYWDRYHYDGWYIFGNEGGGGTVNRDRAHGSWLGGEFTFTHRLSTSHRLTAGTEFRQSLQQDQLNYDDAPSRVVYLDDRRRLAMWAANLQDEFTVSPRVRLNAAVRYESVPMGRARATPKVGVITRLSAASTLKLLYSRALRSPSVYERFYQSPPNYVSNPALAPEKIETVEVAVEHALSPWAHVSGSVFANRLTGLIVSETDETDVIRFVNGLNTTARGFEFAWTSQSRAGVHIRASYSGIMDARERAGPWVDGAPRELAKFNLGVPIEGLGMTSGFSMQVAGRRTTHTEAVLAPVAVATWNLTRSLGRNGELQGSIFNLFNRRYSEPASTDHVQSAILQDGRQIAVKVLWHFR